MQICLLGSLERGTLVVEVSKSHHSEQSLYQKIKDYQVWDIVVLCLYMYCICQRLVFIATLEKPELQIYRYTHKPTIVCLQCMYTEA